MSEYIYKSYKYRAYPNENQVKHIKHTFGCVRFVYNYFLNRKKSYYEENKKDLLRSQCSRELTVLKNTEGMEWLNIPSRSALSAALDDLNKAYERFFKGISNYPQFKKKKDNRGTYRVQNAKNDIEIIGNYIKIPKLRKVKIKKSIEPQGRILSAIISLNADGKYYIILRCEIKREHITQMQKTNKQIGIDLGIKTFCTLSNGILIDKPDYKKKLEKKIAKINRRMSKKIKHSKNWEKDRLKVAKLYRKASNQNYDFLQKLSTKLVKEYDVICIENLNEKEMIDKGNKNITKEIYQLSWYNFINMLQYKADWYGKKVIKIDRWYPSSQLCSNCGYQNKNTKNLKIREWICPQCGTQHDRDVNAAINILNEGLRQFNS